jgi:cysteine synthase A
MTHQCCVSGCTLPVFRAHVACLDDYHTDMHHASTIPERFRALDAMIGNTPLLALHFRLEDREHIIYAKAEFLNLTGSIKDRMALHVLHAAYRMGTLKAGDTIAEATSGNTGIALAAIGRALKFPVVIYMPDWMSRERVALIRSLGAQIEPISAEQGGFLGSIAACEALKTARDDVFLPRQFSNEGNVEAHRLTTGPEISAQLARRGLKPTAFVAGVGTGGTVMGVGRHLKAQDSGVRVHPIEPAESPILSTGHKIGRHRIAGISDEFIPRICQLSSLDSIIGIADGDAILMAQKLAGTLGLGVGVSSGANFLGAVRALQCYGSNATIATVFCDDNKKYLSTDLLREEPLKSDYLAPRIELLGYEALPRLPESLRLPTLLEPIAEPVS